MGIDLSPFPAAGVQAQSSQDRKGASQCGKQGTKVTPCGSALYLANALALYREHLHLGEVVVKRHHVGDNGFLIGVFCEDICKGKGCMLRTQLEAGNVGLRGFSSLFLQQEIQLQVPSDNQRLRMKV